MGTGLPQVSASEPRDAVSPDPTSEARTNPIPTRVGRWSLFAQTGRMTWSPEVFEAWGFPPELEPPPYEALVELMVPETRERLTALIERAIEFGEPYETILHISRPDGEPRALLACCDAIDRGAKGAVLLRGSLRDLSETLRAERTRCESSAASLVEAAGLGRLDPGPDRSWHLDERAEELFGLQLERPLGFIDTGRVLRALHIEDRARCEQFLTRGSGSGSLLVRTTPQHFEPRHLELRRRGGLEVVAVLDVSDRESERAELEAAHLALGEVKRRLESTQRRLADTLGAALASSSRASSDLARTKLATWSQLQSLDDSGLECRRVSGSELSDAVLEHVQPLATHLGARIEVGPLPALYGDPRVLGLGLAQLLENALRHARPGTSPRVQLRGESGSAGTRLFVRDEGGGIRHEHLTRLFEPFDAIDGDGLGVGLAIARRAAELHGGRVEVRSSVGAGSTFTLVLGLGPGPRAC